MNKITLDKITLHDFNNKNNNNRNVPTPYYPNPPPQRNRPNPEGGYTYERGLTFEEWAHQMNTPGVNRCVNKFGMTMSIADSPKIFPGVPHSNHGIPVSNHGSIPLSLNGRVSF